MIRTVNIDLDHVTQHKKDVISSLLNAYRGAINFYCKSLWNTPGKLDGDTEKRLHNSRLTARYRSRALKTALAIVITTRRALKVTRKYGTVPVLTGMVSLDQKFVTIEPGEKSFDYVLRLSSLSSGNRITIPFNAHKRLQHWLAQPGAVLKQACQLSEDRLKLYVEIPDQPVKTDGRVLGIDVGINKLIATSDNKFLGTSWKALSLKIRRCRAGSAGRQRAYRERDNFINRTVNQLPWSDIKTIGIEDLNGMKTGKRQNRSKAFRKALAPWLYRRLLTRIEVKAQENRVRPVRVPAANSSRECPRCGMVSKLNRTGEDFRCIRCGHAADADYVGAAIVLARTVQILGSQSPPVPKTRTVNES